MKILMNLLILAPLISMGQDAFHLSDSNKNKGIHFEKGLTWQQVKEKAEKENKYIFVDCYATWCGPCKMMDKNIYTNESLGDFINKEFVSIRLQCDTSKNDSPDIQTWYGDAHRLLLEYNINEYPTFLFFSSTGEVVHRGLGYQTCDNLMALSKDATNPEKQYYILLKHYRAGVKDYSVIPYLVAIATAIKETELSSSIAIDYTRNYLENLSDAEFSVRKIFDFIALCPTIISSKDKSFKLCFYHASVIDSIMFKGYSNSFVNYVIYKEEVQTRLREAKKSHVAPEWKMIAGIIANKFEVKYVKENILKGKVSWFRSQKDWKNYTKYLVQMLEQDSIQSSKNVGTINSAAWEIFQRSKNRQELKKALYWTESALKVDSEPYPTAMDTKANLLYKLGKKKNALELEAKAAALAPQDEDIQGNFRKMNAGEPTWLVD